MPVVSWNLCRAKSFPKVSELQKALLQHNLLSRVHSHVQCISDTHVFTDKWSNRPPSQSSHISLSSLWAGVFAHVSEPYMTHGWRAEDWIRLLLWFQEFVWMVWYLLQLLCAVLYFPNVYRDWKDLGHITTLMDFVQRAALQRNIWP